MSSNNSMLEEVRPRIFEQEATGLLSDLMGCPAIGSHLMFADEDGLKRAKNYIVDVLQQCYAARQIKLSVVCDQSNANDLIGYALTFHRPGYPDLCYCHKIFVYEQHRGYGAGSRLLANLKEKFKGLGLLCPPDKVSFYTRAGMENLGPLSLPDDEYFQITRHMYVGLNIMVQGEMSVGEMPIFMLNDDDARNIMALLSS